MLERLRLLYCAPLEVTGRAFLDVVVSRIADGTFAARERNQNLSRRAADTIRIRMRTSEQFVELGGIGELDRFSLAYK